MRIALNLLGYTPCRSGVETYLVNLVRALQTVDLRNDYLLLCDPISERSFPIAQPNFVIQRHPVEKPSVNWFFRGVTKSLCGFDLLTWQLNDLDVDVVHHPLTTLNPPNLPYPAVLTFHDLQHEFFPDLFSKKELIRRRKEYLFSVQQAQAVIAISRHVKDCLVNRYSVPPEKIHIVHHGYSKQFKQLNDPERLASTVKKYSLNQPFIIYPAATWAHKNHLRLLGAVHNLVQRGCFDGELLLTGVPMDCHGQVQNEIARLGLDGVVRWLGFIPDEDFPCLYNLARFMVFPSLFEGFGLPVIEAMACGCPIAISNTTALPEVAGGAAVLFDPESAEDIAETMSRLWESDTQREQLIQEGLKRVEAFDWEKSAMETLDVYRGVCLDS